MILKSNENFLKLANFYLILYYKRTDNKEYLDNLNLAGVSSKFNKLSSKKNSLF